MISPRSEPPSERPLRVGSTIAADGDAVDTLKHARQAGHDELCVWSMSART